ncbi:MAG: hypothetical protein WCF25_11735 [Acidimicrobiales bacterium]
MRRIIFTFVVALAVAVFYGVSSFGSGLAVNGTTLSSSTFRSELAAISSNATLACYVAALDPTSFSSGAGGSSMVASGAAAWANLRVEGIALDQYAKKNFKFHPNAATLAKAQESLEGQLGDASESQTTPCTGTPVQALAAMPTEMRNFEIGAQAASLELVAKLDTTIPLTTASARTYYDAHTADYDTICVSVAVVEPTQLTQFAQAQAEGMSVAELAKKFSQDSSGKTGGAYGCFGPGSESFTGVRSDTISTALNTFPKTPEYIDYNNAEAALFVAPTKRTVTPFAKAESAVLTDIQSANASAANTEKESILYYSAISIDPAFGRWGLGTSGPQVFAPALPSSKVVGSQTVAALGLGASTYK